MKHFFLFRQRQKICNQSLFLLLFNKKKIGTVTNLDCNETVRAFVKQLYTVLLASMFVVCLLYS